MKTLVVGAIVAILSISAAPHDAVAFGNPNAASTGIVDDAAAGWAWSGMTSYSDIGLVNGAGRAGGPGAYGVYTFTGTGVDVYAMKAASVDIDGRVHRIGKLKISLDGQVKAEVSLSDQDQDFDFNAYSVSGLAPRVHVLQVEPDDGWAVVNYIRVGTASAAIPSDTAKGDTSTPGEAGLLFSSKESPLGAIDVVDAKSNVGGFNDGIGPELQIGILPADWGLAPIYAHSGNSALRYSGSSTAAPAYCYMFAYTVKIPVASNTWLNYWILPQQDNGRYVAVDLHCTDGTSLSQSGALDQNGVSVAPATGHGGAIPLYAWSPVRCQIGQWLAGKTIDKIWIGYARATAGGQYRGYIDDLTIGNMPPTSK